MSDSTRDFFDTLAKVLLRCSIIGFGLLLCSLLMFLLAGDVVDAPQRHMFGLSAHEIDLIFYGGLGLLKLLVLTLFFVPWLAIRMVLRKGKG